ncbi:hypothetical protein OSB04_022072 [Centaurea solstitialis]|uniref:Uncharacterized protein n=1 Tax=Centaurea solstitialis TaxID=347529 RepID=A0AA38WGV7_9ASTR|nr:hypothetical protein OSB04_022072 [Centaurea solstitialis]
MRVWPAAEVAKGLIQACGDFVAGQVASNHSVARNLAFRIVVWFDLVSGTLVLRVLIVIQGEWVAYPILWHVRDAEAFRCQCRIAGTNWHKFKGVSSKYNGGRISAAQHGARMRDELGRDPTDAELYERLHTSKRKPVLNVTSLPMDPPSKAAKKMKTYARVEEETCVGSNFNTVPLDGPELSVDSVGSQHKGRLSGVHTDKDPKFAKIGYPNAISSTKRSSYDSQSVEVNALKEKLASCEDELKTEKRRRLALEQQYKETADELASKKALIQEEKDKTEMSNMKLPYYPFVLTYICTFFIYSRSDPSSFIGGGGKLGQRNPIFVSKSGSQFGIRSAP